MTGEEKSRLLKTWALDEGFDRAGVAVLAASENRQPFLAWIDRGDHAGMEYLERRRTERLDPRRLFDGARSALCVALQYAPAGGGRVTGDLWPGVARYARGDDYHEVMKERLRRLEKRVADAFPGVVSRPYVDTGPVLERELAARAGVGVVGKNTNLLHPEAGSWFLLAELLLSLDLAPDPALTDLCGSCTRCLEACPTGALPQPYRLDSRRCISYWTIEHRGAIPVEMRPLLAEWVFGCDVCQEVCPVNVAPRPRADRRFELPDHRLRLDLVDLLELRREGYLESFRGSAMKRARLDGLQRNAAVAMGNRGERRYLPALERALSSGDPLVRGHAAWALGRIGGEEASRALRAALQNEPQGSVKREIEAALRSTREGGQVG